jgi:hypothetical protein
MHTLIGSCLLSLQTGLFAVGIAPAQGVMEEWTAIHQLRVGGYDGEYAFTDPSGGALDSHGRLHVLHPQEHIVRVFCREGRLVGSMGQRGRGPGEFEAPIRLGWSGDDLWVFDAATSRISTWADGHFVAALSLARLSSRVLPDRLLPLSVHGDTALVAMRFPVLSAGSPEHIQVPLVNVSLATQRLDTIASVLLRTPTQLKIDASRVAFTGHVPVNDGSFAAASPRASFLVIVDQPPPRSLRSGEYTISKIGMAGDTIRQWRRAYVPKRISSEYHDLLVGGILERVRRHFANDHAARRAIENSIGLPEYLPPVSQVFVDGDDRIWIQHSSTEAGNAEWMVLELDREVTRRLFLPSRTRVVAAAGEDLWGIELDEDDVPYLVLYSLREANAN